MKLYNLLQNRKVKTVAVLLATLLLLLAVAVVAVLATQGPAAARSVPSAAPTVTTNPVSPPTVSTPPLYDDEVTAETPPPATPEPKTETFYGVLTLEMDPTWTILQRSTSSTYIGTTDVEKRCHSLTEACPQLRIFNVQASADEVASTYADCDTPPLSQGPREIGNATAQYYEVKPCHVVADPSDFHRIWVIPNKVVIVSQGFNDWEVTNLQRALDSATVR